jgi:hypothetical protein
MYVASVSYGCCKSRSGCCICCKCFRGMLQAFVQNVSSVSDVCCKRFLSECCTCSHICCKSMFEMFQLFQSYVAICVFMLQVAGVLFGCCICFTHMLQVYVLNVSSSSDVCCIQVFHVASIFVFQRYVQRVTWAQPKRWGKGHGETGASVWGAQRA